MKGLCLGMYGMARGELSYEARIVHQIAKLGVDIDYYTDVPVDYSKEVYEQPKTLRNIVFAKGAEALSTTPRMLTATDVRNILLGQPYDFIYGTATTALDMGTWVRELLRIPLICEVYDVPTWRILPLGPSQIYRESMMPLPLLPEAMFDRYRAEWNWWFSKMNEADAIVNLHSVTKKQLIEFLGQDKGNIYVVHHGSIDKDAMDAHYDPTIPKKYQILHMARLDFHKGVDKFIYVAHLVQQILKDDPPRIVIASSGTFDWYERLLQEYAAKMLKNYAFTGWIPNKDKFRLLQESNVTVECTWDDGTTSGCIAGESMYFGTPVVCWHLPQSVDVYQNHAYYIPKNDYLSMAACVVDLLQGKIPWDYPAAKEFMAQYRSIESHARDLIRVFDKFTGG